MPYYTLEIEPDGTVRQKRTKFVVPVQMGRFQQGIVLLDHAVDAPEVFLHQGIALGKVAAGCRQTADQG